MFVGFGLQPQAGLAQPWPSTTTKAAGLSEGSLAAALSYAEAQKSSEVLILHRGAIVAEVSWSPPLEGPYARMRVGSTEDGHAIEDVASVQKSFVSFLVGMALDRDLLDLEQPVSAILGSGWSSAPALAESKILLRHLLSMTSGLKPNGSFEAEVGSVWRYNTRIYSVTVALLEKVTKKSINELTKDWLAPLAMTDTSWVERKWVRDADANNVGLATTARDLARFGQAVLENGEVGGQAVGSKKHLAMALESSQDLNPAYGHLWWLNGKEFRLAARGRRVDSFMVPSAPADLVAANGALGRFVWIVPSRELVIVRLGDAPARDFAEGFWSRLLEP